MQVNRPVLKSGTDSYLSQIMEFVDDLISTVDATATKIQDLSEERAEWHPFPGAWSLKELIGHLVDSASNNHQRFVRALWKEDLRFDTYAQDDWIAAQRYQSAPIRELVELWRLFNHHIARIILATPSEVRMRPHTVHNFHEIAWQTIPESEPATLDYLMRDYVGHLKHHVMQINSLFERSKT